MFGKKNEPSSQGSIDCLISAKTRVEGDIHFEGGLRVDGSVKGNLSGNGSSLLIISEQASLEGEVQASRAVINGTIKGAVRVANQLELQPKARITGDVHYHTLEMHPGAVVEGRLVHESQGAGKTADKTVTALPTSRANG